MQPGSKNESPVAPSMAEKKCVYIFRLRKEFGGATTIDDGFILGCNKLMNLRLRQPGFVGQIFEKYPIQSGLS